MWAPLRRTKETSAPPQPKQHYCNRDAIMTFIERKINMVRIHLAFPFYFFVQIKNNFDFWLNNTLNKAVPRDILCK